VVNLEDLNAFDERLLAFGIDSFSNSQKTDFIIYLSSKLDVAITDIDDLYLLDYHKQIKTSKFSRLCEEDILKGFTSETTGHTYRTTRDDQFNMFAEYVMTKDNPLVETIMYKCEDEHSQVAHTKAEFSAVVMEGFAHVKGKLTKLDEIRKQIRECSTDAELITIKW
jgi:hypothetical protein